MAHYPGPRRPYQLDETIAITDADWMIIQKDGSNITTRIPVALLAAHFAGTIYRAASVELSAGDNIVAFSSALSDNLYKVFYYVRNTDGNTVGNELYDDQFTINGFPIWVKSACKLTYYAIPIK